MNDWDRDNINFILNADKNELAAFYDSCDSKDLAYLFRLVNWEIGRLRVVEAEEFDKVVDTDKAESILKKFMLNK
jgi:hypothetical protein